MSDNLNQSIEQHYLKEGLLEDIVSRLREQGINLENLQRKDIAGVDEFHVRGAAVSNELAQAINLSGRKVLDVGCGLGGPCRMLADEYDCHATGVDLSNEFIRTAKGLTKLVRLDHKTEFVVGSATNLPFEDNSFDVVWTQHVQMNIPDKDKFYGEIARVLKPGGHFLYYDIFRKNDEEVTYPMPWASNADQSFLFKRDVMNDILSNRGLVKMTSTDQTIEGINFFEALMTRLREVGPPKIGLNVLMGESTAPKLSNVLAHLKKGIIELESGVYVKP